MNCPKYKRDLDAGKVEKKHHKGILVIELNLNIATSIQDWVCDTSSCAHLVSNVQALRNRRSLKKGDVVMKVGNGAFISAVAVGSLDLHLSSGLVLNLKDVYYVPSVLDIGMLDYLVQTLTVWHRIYYPCWFVLI